MIPPITTISSSNYRYYQKKFYIFKIFMAFDYFFGMMGSVFRNFWLTANGISLSSLYLFSVLGTLIALISQNTIAKYSDKINWRYPFLIAAGFSQVAAYLVSAWLPSLEGFLFYVIVVSWITGENYRTLIAYNFIVLSQEPNILPENINRTREFAKYRIFGSVGFAIAGPIVGYSIQAINVSMGLNPIDGLSGYQVMYTFCAIGLIWSTIILVFILRDYIKIEPTFHLFPTNSQKKDSNEFKNSPTEKFGLKELFSNRIYLAVLIPQLIYAFAESIGFGTIDIFFKSLGADTIFIGIRPLIWALAEVPLFFLSARIYRKFSHELPMLIGYLFFLLKITVYFLFLTPEYLWIALIFQALNSFGISYPAITNTIREKVPESPSFALSVYSTLQGICTLLGGLVGFLFSYVAKNNDQAFDYLFITAMILMSSNIIILILLNLSSKKQK